MASLDTLFDSLGNPPRPPRQRPHRLSGLLGDRYDEFFYLKDSHRPSTQSYLGSEKEYWERFKESLDPLTKVVLAELREKVPVRHETFHLPLDGYEYWSVIDTSLDYPAHWRSRPDGSEKMMLLDENALAESHPYQSLNGLAISPNHEMLAYGVDHTGDETFLLSIAQITSKGTRIVEQIPQTSYGFLFTEDSSALLYITADHTMRPYRLYLHRIGTDPSRDTLLFEEVDASYNLDIARSKDRTLLLITVESKIASEVWCLDATSPTSRPQCFCQRKDGVEYALDHGPLGYLIASNRDSEEFALYTSPTIDSPWQPLDVLGEGELLENFEILQDGIAVVTRSAGELAISYFDSASQRRFRTTRDVEPRSLALGPNPEISSRVFRYERSSLRQPSEIVEVDPTTGKETVVWGLSYKKYDPAQYRSFCHSAVAPDGTTIPITVITPLTAGPYPTVLYGYGAYEDTLDPTFSASRVSLLSRGVAFALAHVRGGGELGRAWYDAGRRENKVNSFLDFEAAGDSLRQAGIASSLILRGGSAGGLLVAATLNRDPSKYTAAVLEVPFVDCLTTMSDPSLPLTITEWDEWGNPLTDPDAAALIASYAPYDNISRDPYPALYVSTAMNDMRVGFWEPLKYVARLRSRSPSTRIVLQVDSVGGHLGASEREAAWEEESRILAFILTAVEKS